MKHSLLHQVTIFFAAFGLFFSAAILAHAETFTPPQQYQHPGLTFSDSLTYSQPLPISDPTTDISFSSQQKLVIEKENGKGSSSALTITPTVANKDTDTTFTPIPSMPQPTPTIFLQQNSTEITPSPTPTIEPSEQPTLSTSLPADRQDSGPTATPTPAYTPVPQANPGGLNASVLFSMVNSYRQTQGLPAFQQDSKTCSLAQERAPQVAGEVASGNFHAGLKAMNLPYWNTENIISMNSEQAAFNWWLNDPIHHAAIVSSNIYSCVACSGNSCAEEFTSYQSK